jgi:hypothetical protein
MSSDGRGAARVSADYVNNSEKLAGRALRSSARGT